MLTRKYISFSLIMMVALILSACGSQATTTPVPTQAPPTPVPPSATPTVEPTPTFEPEVQVTSAEEIAGVWLIISQPGSMRGNLTFAADGNYVGKIVEGQFKGVTVDSGKFWFDGSHLNLQTSGKCQNAKGDAFDCIGVYDVYSTNQGGYPVQLRFVAVDDKYAGRRSDLTRSSLSIVVTP